MKWALRNKTAEKRLKMAIFKLMVVFSHNIELCNIVRIKERNI